jgi:general secretion pathway protein C
MQAISLERSSFAQSAVVSLVTLTALVLLGLVLAYWTWVWLAPRPEPRAQAAVQTGGRALEPTQAASGLFGSAQRDRNGAAPTGIAIRLLGVVAATGRQPGYAVVQLEARQILAVREGEEIAPGIRLGEVHPDHVILVRNGVRESLAWPQKNAAAESAVPPVNK